MRILYTYDTIGKLPSENLVLIKNKNDDFDHPEGKVYYMEDIDKKNVWLELNSSINYSRDNLVILGAAKYYKLSSKKTDYLHMISEKCDNVYIVDYLFCCNGVENIYNPLSYVDRSILGYAHYYAWQANYQEVYQGELRSAFDPYLIFSKMKDYVYYDLQRINRNWIKLNINVDSYNEYRDQLFEDECPPNRLVTKLSDYVVSIKERAVMLKDWIDSKGFDTRPSLVFNIKANQKNYRCIDADLNTYNDSISNGVVIYVEPILVKEYQMDRIEQKNPNADYYHIWDSTKVSKYLKEKVEYHIESNDKLKEVFDEGSK